MIDKKQLTRFVEHILKNNRDNTLPPEKAFSELKYIMERNSAEPETLEMLEGMVIAAPELQKLGKEKKYTDLSEEEIAKAIRDGRERKRRRDAMRC